MKSIILSFILVIAALKTYGQDLGDNEYTLTFEDTFYTEHLSIDTINNQNGLWQIGTPQKTVFSSAISSPNVIVTDTINPYPTNTASSFTIVNLAFDGLTFPHTVLFNAYYHVNTDTLTDFGTIEFSPDNGITWIDIVNDTIYTDYLNWYTDKPILTGNSGGWQNFTIELSALGPLFEVAYGDTLLYRFSFTSDSIQTYKDGLMFDNIYFVDYVESISTHQNNDNIIVFPNPAHDLLNIRTNSYDGSAWLQIFDTSGEILYSDTNFLGPSIDIRQFSDGIYFIKYSCSIFFAVKRFVVQH